LNFIEQKSIYTSIVIVEKAFRFQLDLKVWLTRKLPCPAKLWPLVKLWPKLVKIPNGFQNIRFTPLEIRGTVTDISD
jgi:hypothetical protein